MKALIALLLVLLIFGGWWLVTEWRGNEVTVHEMFCTGGRVQEECKSKEETANPTTYKVFVDQQTVVYWVWNSEHLTRFTFCAVRDVYNWSCKFERADEVPTREYQMIDGEYRQTAAGRERYILSCLSMALVAGVAVAEASITPPP